MTSKPAPPYAIVQPIPPELADDPPALNALYENLRTRAEEQAGTELPPGEYREVLYGHIDYDVDPPSWVPCSRDKANIAHVRVTYTDGRPYPGEVVSE